MINKHFISALSEKLCTTLPGEFNELGQETKDNIAAIIQATFEKFDLVSREEFDVQAKVLARTRATLAELERQVAELERRQ